MPPQLTLVRPLPPHHEPTPVPDAAGAAPRDRLAVGGVILPFPRHVCDDGPEAA